LSIAQGRTTDYFEVFMRKSAIIMIMALMLVPAPCFTSEEDGSPRDKVRYVWASLRKYWDTNCIIGLEIKDFSRTQDGYIVRYPQGVRMEVTQQGRYITKICGRFKPDENYGGGRIFLNLVDSMIKVGTFRWPTDKVEEVKETFSVMTKSPVEYKWRASHFTLNQSSFTGWEFTLYFLNVHQ
jgi:hypothetical protein